MSIEETIMDCHEDLICNMSLVSVIIPAYNCQEYIEQCVQSVHDHLVERNAFKLVERAFKNWVIGSIFFNFTILKSWQSFCELFDYLRSDNNRALRQLDLLDVPHDYYFFDFDRRKMQALLNASDAHEFLFALWRESCVRAEQLTDTESAYEEASKSVGASTQQLFQAAKESLRRGLCTFRK